MTATILVAHATRYGSTQEVAETIAATLRECGLTVECQPVKKVHTLEGYDGVVLGAPLYMFHWLGDAKGFLARHRQALLQRPVVVFALGPFHQEAKEFQEARGQLDKELANFPWFAPVAIEIFGGKFDPAALRFPYNLIPALKRMPASDARDWTAIRTWANGQASRLQTPAA